MPFDHQTVEAPRAPQAAARSTAVGGAAAAPLRSLRSATPASMLRLQRLAGNAAVQRAVEIDELAVSSSSATTDGGDQATTAPAGATGSAGGNTLGDGTGPATINGPAVDVNAPVVNLHSGVVNADGIVRCSTIIADSVVASSYTPGAGNLF